MWQNEPGKRGQSVKKMLKESAMSEKKYLKTHLKEMEEKRKRWYLNAMKTWTRKDYNNYTNFHLWMMGYQSRSDRPSKT